MTELKTFVYRDKRHIFLLLIICFAAWGVAANMTDPLVKVFSKVFVMSQVEAALVQFAYYGAYFCLALPAAFINRRYSYKTGVLTGLGLATFGAFAFYPASQVMEYHFFLLALFTLAAGLSILETSANPFVMALGPEENATQRLNLAQAFNPVGTNIGVFLAATLILPNLNVADATARAMMPLEALQQVQAEELKAVMFPYVAMACVLFVIWLLIFLIKIPSASDVETQEKHKSTLGCFRRLYANKHYRYGVIAQFFNVAAQVCIWTYTIQYVQEAIGGTEAEASLYLQYSLLVFLLARFTMTGIMTLINPSRLMVILALVGSLLCLYAASTADITGIWAVVLLSACLSLMFPTIYGVALQKLGDDTKFGAAGLVMAILGGAIVPLLQGSVVDNFTTAISYVVPAGCFLIVATYGYFDLKSSRR